MLLCRFPPSQDIASRFDELSKRYGNSIEFARVDVDEAEKLASSCGIECIPTLHFFKDARLELALEFTKCEYLEYVVRYASKETDTIIDDGEL